MRGGAISTLISPGAGSARRRRWYPRNGWPCVRRDDPSLLEAILAAWYFIKAASRMQLCIRCQAKRKAYLLRNIACFFCVFRFVLFLGEGKGEIFGFIRLEIWDAMGKITFVCNLLFGGRQSSVAM